MQRFRHGGGRVAKETRQEDRRGRCGARDVPTAVRGQRDDVPRARSVQPSKSDRRRTSESADLRDPTVHDTSEQIPFSRRHPDFTRT